MAQALVAPVPAYALLDRIRACAEQNMAWSSTTRVTRVGEFSKEAIWRRIDARDKQKAAKVCCYALQGNCWRGDTCEFSHDLSLAKGVGCQFGRKCRIVHEAAYVEGLVFEDSSDDDDSG